MLWLDKFEWWLMAVIHSDMAFGDYSVVGPRGLGDFSSLHILIYTENTLSLERHRGV